MDILINCLQTLRHFKIWLEMNVPKEAVPIKDNKELLSFTKLEPTNKADESLNRYNDPHFTSELTLYNLEMYLDPLVLNGRGIF